MKSKIDRIVVVGGGFAGTTFAQHAETLFDETVKIAVISRDNHLLFTPMLPELACRAVSAANIAVPGRSLTKRTSWFEGSVTAINREKQIVSYLTPAGETVDLSYSHVILACGSEASLEGIPGLRAHGLTVKTAGDALLLSNQIIERFESAASEKNAEKQKALLHAVVIGGGFSGVEVAGQLNDMMSELVKSYPEILAAKPRVTVLHKGERILPEFSHEGLSKFALDKLRKNGVEVLLEISAKEVTGEYVLLESGERVSSRLVISTIGTVVAPLISDLGLPLEKNRVKTEDDMRVVDQPNIWAIGDCAVTKNAFNGKPTPPTAQFALREAEQLAKNILRVANREATRPFRFRPQGMLASIGRRNGVAEVFGLQFSGFIAWLMWRAIYLAKIPSLSSKIGVALDWFGDAIFKPSMTKVRLPGTPPPRRIHYGEGDPVFDSRNSADLDYLIEKGRAGLYLKGEDKPVAYLESGDLFGSSVLRGELGSELEFQIEAETSLDVIALDGPAFLQFADSFPPLRERLHNSQKGRAILTRLLQEQSTDSRLAQLTAKDNVIPLKNRFPPETTLRQAVDRFDPAFISYWVMNDSDEILGFITRVDLYAALASKPIDTILSDILSPAPKPIQSDENLVSATINLLRTEFPTLPVTGKDGRIAGLFDPLRLMTSHEVGKQL